MARTTKKQKRYPKSGKRGKRGPIGRLWYWAWRLAVGFVILTCFWVIALRFVNPPTTFLMIQRSLAKEATGNDARKIQHTWINYEDISDHLKRAAIASEDANFMKHRGLDLGAIKKAYEESLRGKRLRGGSTISQQTAKNIFLWPQRSWIRKGLETYFTVLIELFWGKKRILEVYLNMIETGDRIFGVESAAQHYFGRSAANVSQRQAALLIAVLPNPRRWNPARPTAFINRKTNNILRYINHYEIP